MNYFFARKKDKYGNPKEKSLAVLLNELQEVFNRWVRKRDSNGGYFICISCGYRKPVSQMDASHYWPVKNFAAVRFDEVNVNGGCRFCNRFNEGNRQGYAKGIVRKWGREAVEKLELRARNLSKLTRFEVQYMINEYKKKLER